MDIRDYINLIEAALQEIEPGYFNLKTTYEPSGIVRERVFCYELYHQIRLLMKKDIPISLNGEIDKRGHLDFKNEDRKNPDFVFHIPGTHRGNTLLIEVKGTLNYSHDEFVGDFETLLTFVNNYQYQSGIFILYNHSYNELLSAHGEALKELKSNPKSDSIYIISINTAGTKPEENILVAIP